jgi:probable phosphoglycerate mutase
VRPTSLYSDGATSPTNPGPSGAGALAYAAGSILFELAEPLGWMSNNEAEYNALLLGLRKLLSYGERGPVEVHADSRLVICQLRGEWKVKQERLRPLWLDVRREMDWFDSVTLTWVPREQNTVADRLSKEGRQKCGS